MKFNARLAFCNFTLNKLKSELKRTIPLLENRNAHNPT